MWRAFLTPWAGLEYFHPEESRPPSFDMIQAAMQVMGSRGMGREMFEQMWNSGEITNRSFEGFRHEAVKAWTAMYEAAIQPVLKVPQVGLTRVYKEKINRLTDKFNAYQAALSEFQVLLSGPMEKSFADMRMEIEAARVKGEQADNFEIYYGMWIKVLENHYMSLFRSEDYRRALTRLMDETAAFRITGNDVLMEFLEFLPIPTNKEMDELYKDLYTLKKQIKEYAKKINKIESASGKKEIK
jgi:class III poly(R)-hydroxyalkanoic acid synthase PhaE subunit